MPSESVWSALTPAPIVFKTSQTPLIFDPFSTIVRASISVCEKKKSCMLYTHSFPAP